MNSVSSLPPRVGILGGGQLARMLALAGAPLGIRCLQLAPQDEVAGGIVETLQAQFDDEGALRRLAERVDVVTFESENVPVSALRFLDPLVRVRPAETALITASDRWAEKALFDRLGIPTAPWVPVATEAELHDAVAAVGLPAVLKTRRLGYDGRGQLVCREPAELDGAWRRLGGVPLLCEAWVPFQREVSIIIARGEDGAVRWYPPSENAHENGILRSAHAPAPDLTDDLVEMAREYSLRIAEAFGYVGVLALELFQTGDELFGNEIAPRVHNTGHWTIEGAHTSQFENHLRAILGWPLGSTEPYGHWIMVNLIGETPPLPDLLAIEGTHVHMYGKTPRPGRKVGHITASVSGPAEARQRAAELRRIIDRSPALG